MSNNCISKYLSDYQTHKNRPSTDTFIIHHISQSSCIFSLYPKNKTQPQRDRCYLHSITSVLAQKILKDLFMITWQVMANLEVEFSPDFNLQLSIFQEDMSKFQSLFGG